MVVHFAFHFLFLFGPEHLHSLANVLVLAELLLPLTQLLNLRITANQIASPEGLDDNCSFLVCQ